MPPYRFNVFSPPDSFGGRPQFVPPSPAAGSSLHERSTSPWIPPPPKRETKRTTGMPQTEQRYCQTHLREWNTSSTSSLHQQRGLCNGLWLSRQQYEVLSSMVSLTHNIHSTCNETLSLQSYGTGLYEGERMPDICCLQSLPKINMVLLHWLYITSEGRYYWVKDSFLGCWVPWGEVPVRFPASPLVRVLWLCLRSGVYSGCVHRSSYPVISWQSTHRKENIKITLLQSKVSHGPKFRRQDLSSHPE